MRLTNQLYNKYQGKSIVAKGFSQETTLGLLDWFNSPVHLLCSLENLRQTGFKDL